MPRTVPSKVIQTSIKQNYQHLAFIPLVNHCLNIKHLYLSHNKIASLQGIESYPELVSLNISYNCLTKVSELALITHPEKMIKISLRMNKFEFGYEDEVVQIFQNLRKMENEALGERKVQD
jgi:Leucine-rich repeat (LRR) protein